MLKKKKSGFTLLEMILVVSLTVVVIGITTSMFITGNRVFSDSDVKSSLQMEARDIQEELTSIGVQGIGVTDVKINGVNKNAIDNTLYVNKKYSDLTSDAVNQLEIKGYSKDSEYTKDNNGQDTISNLQTYNISLTDTTLHVGSKILSTNIRSFKVKPEDTSSAFANASSIEFNIILSKRNVEYPINVKVTFRNKY